MILTRRRINRPQRVNYLKTTLLMFQGSQCGSTDIWVRTFSSACVISALSKWISACQTIANGFRICVSGLVFAPRGQFTCVTPKSANVISQYYINDTTETRTSPKSDTKIFCFNCDPSSWSRLSDLFLTRLIVSQLLFVALQISLQPCHHASKQLPSVQ